jgi:hypothetical protein
MNLDATSIACSGDVAQHSLVASRPRKGRLEMSRSRAFTFAATVGASLATAAIVVPSLVAQPSSGAVANFTPGKVKLYHTGGSAPSSQYADLGRLTLPVGSWAITAHTVLLSQAPTTTGIDCYLTPPGAPAVHTPMELSNAKGENIKDLSLLSVTTAPNGGKVDLLCRVSTASADRKVFAQDTGIVAVSVSGATVSYNPAPAVGTY